MKKINYDQDESQICIHHIGGKGGIIDFPVLPKFFTCFKNSCLEIK